MTRFFLRWIISVVAFYAAILIVPGIHYSGGWLGVLALALIAGLLNAFIRPLLQLLTCPLIILTLGLFTLVINTLIFSFTASIGRGLGIEIQVDGFWAAFFGGLVVSIVSVILSLILKDELRGRRIVSAG
jgi:putative membrane protein